MILRDLRLRDDARMMVDLRGTFSEFFSEESTDGERTLVNKRGLGRISARPIVAAHHRDRFPVKRA